MSTKQDALLEKAFDLISNHPRDFAIHLPQYNANAKDTANIVVSVLKEAATSCPIGALRATAGVVLIGIESAQAIGRNNDLYERLTRDAVELIYVVISQYHDPKRQGPWKSMPQNLEEPLFQLLEKAFKVYEFTSKRNSRKWYKKILENAQDKDAIKDYREAIDHAKSVFQIKVTLSIHDAVGEIASGNDEILREIRDLKSQIGVSGSGHNSTASPSPPSFPNVPSSSGSMTVTTVSGDYTINDSSNHINNTNSGNTTTTTITNAYNSRAYRAGRR